MRTFKQLIVRLLGTTSRQPAAPARALPQTIALDPQPDGAQDFGFKLNWFAVRSTDIEAVL